MSTKKDPEDRTLTVIVKAKDLYGLPATELNVDDNTALKDDRGLENSFRAPNKTFETVIARKHKMRWDIEVETPNGEDRGYDVRFSSVTHNPTAGNPNFFDKESLLPGKNTKVVEGHIQDIPQTVVNDDNYTIHFEITNGTTWLSYPLDPKLRLKTRAK